MPSVLPRSGEVHVWLFSLDVPPIVYDQYVRFLSQSEQMRAERFRFSVDKRHYVVAHGCLRVILSHYCHDVPESVVLESLPSGKPRVISESMAAGLEFNLSHSHGCGAVAVARDRAVGIDLEKVRAEVDCRRLAKRYFSAHEQSVVLSTSDEHLAEIFFRHWVGKEACLKATGAGLRLPLDGCEVVLSDDKTGARIRLKENAVSSEVWTVQYLPLEAGWVGGVASGGDQWTTTICFL